MTVIETMTDEQNVSYTLAKVNEHRFAVIVRDEDAGQLITRVEGPESLIRSKFESTKQQLSKN